IPLKEYFLLEVRENGLPALKLLSKIHFAENKIEIPIGKIDVRYSDYENSAFTIDFSSPIHAPNRYHYCCKRQTFDKPFKASSDEFEVVREFVSSNGQAIPVTIVQKKGVEKNSKNPLLVYAYGAYGSSIDLSFYKPYSSLLNRGVILAYAHVRGGGEFGEPWHEAAKKEKKIATFKDLIAVSEYLIDEGYSSNERMALQGGSAGGTLAAGIINMRPDLFRVVLLEVPFVDAITDLNDPSIPYTPQEWEEWGNPQNINELKAIREWSPIDNIKWGAKPAVYITAGMNDVQVPCYEPYKYFAKLKRHQAGKNPILFELIKGGHKGDTGRYSSIRQIAPMYAFLLNQLGIKR
ncbi:MAG: prolyl oligopeptidase family serine peptidase, partial [Parachlamydiaceae bacterium]